MSNVGQANIFSDASEYNALAFVIARATEKMQTVSIVQVKAVDTGAQTVDVQVLVNLVTGASQSIPHGVISARPYYRAQGGGNAIILDPVVGDIGVMVFASRDSSAVIAAKGLANPGSQRKFSWSDGVYFGGILNSAPTQYLEFIAAGGGVTVHSPGDITLDSPLTNVTGDLVVNGDTTVDGTSTLTGAVDAPAGITTTTIAGASAVFTGSVTASSFIGGGGGGGTVTSVDTGTGLTGGPITSSGTIALANTAVTPGSYTLADITIDAQGRITAAASGSAGGGTVTSVGISTPGTGVVVGGGPITASGTLTIDLSSAAYAALVLATTALQSISIATGTGLTGGPLGASGSTVALANTAVTPGSYTYASLTVDAQGRITAASSGAAPTGTVTSVATGTGLTGGPITGTGTISLSAASIASLLPSSPVQGDIVYYNGSAWVNLAPGTAGQILQTGGASANPSWVTNTGGTAANITADTHPATELSVNDEFEAGTVIDTTGGRFSGASAWTAFGAGSLSTSVAEGSLVLTNSGSTALVAGYSQPIAGATWSYTAKVSLQASTGSAVTSGGIFINLTGATSGKIIQFVMTSSSSASLAVQHMTNSTTLSATSYTNATVAIGLANSLLSFYLQIAYDGTNLHYNISATGIPGSFTTVFSELPATFLGGVPTIVGFTIGANSGSSVVSDWFRKTL